MAKPPIVPVVPKKTLSADEIERGIGRIGKRIHELQSFDVSSVQGKSADLAGLSASIRDTLDRCFGEGTTAFKRLELAAALEWQPMGIGPNYPLPQHYQENTRKNIQRAIELLKVGQQSLRDDLEDAGPRSHGQDDGPTNSNRVFVVHGHDAGAKEGLARFLEKVGLEAIILSEQPSAGRTIIEKFESYAAEVAFAVVLLTPDDVGSAVAETPGRARARQNVIFELGYFAGNLGRGRTCLLRKGNVEIPSDLYGVVYIDLAGDDGWKIQLAREMKEAGLTFDQTKIL